MSEMLMIFTSKISKTLLVLCVVCSTYSPAKGQGLESFPFAEDIIKIDPISRKPDKPIPFDRPFSMVVALTNTVDIHNVFAFFVKAKGKKREMDKIIPGVKYRLIEKQLVIDFPPLPPRSHFDFTIVRSLTGEKLIAFLPFVDTLAKLHVEHKVVSAITEEKYTDFNESIQKNFYTEPRTTLQFDHLFKLDTLPGRSLEEWFLGAKVDTLYADIFSISDSSGIPADFSDHLGPIAQLFASAKQDVAKINRLSRFETTDQRKQLALGLSSINHDSYTKPADKFQFPNRIVNLDFTLSELKDLLSISESLYLAGNRKEQQLKYFSDILKICIEKLNSNRKTISNDYNALTKAIKEEKGLKYSEWFINTNDFRDLQTVSGSLFVPQIGLGGLILRRNDNAVVMVPKLMIGLNVFFRPIDKSIKRRFLAQKDWRNYLSLSLALSLGKFNDEQFDNLSTGTSFLIGPALRLNRSFYLSGGWSFYRQSNINPLITTKETKVGGYVTLLLDVDLTNAASSFRNLLFK